MRITLRAALGLTLLLALAVPALSGDEKKATSPEPDMSAVEAALHTNLKDVINRGVDLYNAGDIAGCYRLFEGSLRTIRPLLAHRKDLAADIGEKLAAAEKDPTTWRRAFTLRSALDKVRTELKPRPKASVEQPEKKPEDKKPDDKKPDDKKPDDKKPDDKKPDDKKPDDKKPDDKKPDDKKPDDKKPDDKKPDDKKPDDKKPDDKKPDAPPLLKQPRELKEVDD